MPAFTDASGRAWGVPLTCGDVWRVRDFTGVDLLHPHSGEPPLWRRLQADDALFVDALHALCAPEVSPKSFAASLRGNGLRRWWRGADPDALVPARVAFFGAWAGFWPEPDDEPAPKKSPDVEKTLWHLAGICGVHPAPFSLRQLVLMTEGRGKAQWAQTSVLAAPLFNAIRNQKKKPEPFVPDDFNPYAERKRKEKIRIPIRLLRGMFVKGNGP